MKLLDIEGDGRIYFDEFSRGVGQILEIKEIKGKKHGIFQYEMIIVIKQIVITSYTSI